MRTRRRQSVAVLVVLCGIAIALSTALRWISARGVRPASNITQTSVVGLLHWTYQNTHSTVRSFGLVLIICSVLIIVGGLIASRVLTGLFAVIALAAAGLWIGLNASHYSPTDLPATDLRAGAWLAIGAAVVALISSFFLRRPA
ncbi:MAG TPA: hypothetical protein VNF47_18790 [Streptosporangiaceae bacterium]|nr:hypothetical protein [Streptosporangiaceae bacterium]